MTMYARPRVVAVDATSLIVVKGAPNVPVSWGITGAGTLQPLAVATDAYGIAAAVLTPTGAAGDQLVVSATYEE